MPHSGKKKLFILKVIKFQIKFDKEFGLTSMEHLLMVFLNIFNLIIVNIFSDFLPIFK